MREKDRPKARRSASRYLRLVALDLDGQPLVFSDDLEQLLLDGLEARGVRKLSDAPCAFAVRVCPREHAIRGRSRARRIARLRLQNGDLGVGVFQFDAIQSGLFTQSLDGGVDIPRVRQFLLPHDRGPTRRILRRSLAYENATAIAHGFASPRWMFAASLAAALGPQKVDDLGAVLFRGDSAERLHVVAGDGLLGIGDEAVEGF